AEIGYDVPILTSAREPIGDRMVQTRQQGSPLTGYAAQSFAHAGRTRRLYVRGRGPAVIVLHEIPGITPLVLRFADWLVEAGFRVYLPEVVGVAGKQPSIAYVARSIATICIS